MKKPYLLILVSLLGSPVSWAGDPLAERLQESFQGLVTGTWFGPNRHSRTQAWEQITHSTLQATNEPRAKKTSMIQEFAALAPYPSVKIRFVVPHAYNEAYTQMVMDQDPLVRWTLTQAGGAGPKPAILRQTLLMNRSHHAHLLWSAAVFSLMERAAYVREATDPIIFELRTPNQAFSIADLDKLKKGFFSLKIIPPQGPAMDFEGVHAFSDLTEIGAFLVRYIAYHKEFAALFPAPAWRFLAPTKAARQRAKTYFQFQKEKAIPAASQIREYCKQVLNVRD